MPLDPKKLKARREELGLSQSEAAKKSGISQQHYSLAESGARTDPKLSTSEAIARGLGCNLTELLRVSP